MSLTSLLYFGFLLLVVLLYYVLPRKWNIHLLLLASVAFYCIAMPGQLLIMMVYLWVIFFLGLFIKQSKHPKALLTIGILLSVGFLFFHKYLNFTLSIFSGNSQTFSIIVPIGISYVTFQCISYLVDIVKKKGPVVKNPIWFFTYALFFPKITAGPIEPAGRFFLQLKNRTGFVWENMTTGTLLITTGLVKKLVIADLLAPGVAAVFDTGAGDGCASLLAILMYTLQIFFDFSGYTDIARGSAYLFGIKLTENFKSPYRSTGVVEFWRRWHISLSDWLKNYIYIPLGGSRVGTFRRYVNVFLTFLVSGIWHGANWTFIVWGVLHGVFQMLEMLLKPVGQGIRKALHISENNGFHKFLATIRTFLLVAFAWTFFRAATLPEAFRVLGHIFTKWDLSKVLSTLCLDIRVIVLMLVSGILVTVFRHLMPEERRKNTFAVIIVSILMLILVVLSLLFANSNTASSFIYFNF